MLERFPAKEIMSVEKKRRKQRGFRSFLPIFDRNLARGVANFRLDGHLLYVRDRLHDGRESAQTCDHQLDLGPQPVHYHVQLVHLVDRTHQQVVTQRLLPLLRVLLDANEEGAQVDAIANWKLEIRVSFFFFFLLIHIVYIS